MIHGSITISFGIPPRTCTLVCLTGFALGSAMAPVRGLRYDSAEDDVPPNALADTDSDALRTKVVSNRIRMNSGGLGRWT